MDSRWTAAVVCSLALAGCYAAPGEAPLQTAQAAGEGQFRFVVFDVGQGSAAAVITPNGCAALFDGAPTGRGATLRTALRARGVTRLEFAVASHYHADHVGSLDEVEQGADAIPITAVYDRGGSYTTATYNEYATQFAGRRNTVTVGQTLSLCGEVTVTIVGANGTGLSTTDENALSVAARVSWRGVDVLVGGDLTGEGPNVEALIAPATGPVEVYLVHHHGSRTSSNAAFLGAIAPRVGVISVGANNSYGHPHAETLERLAAAGVAVWRTDAGGGALVEVTSLDGTSFTVTQGAASASYAPHPGGGGDTNAPTAPADLAATAGVRRIDLAWAASTDDVAVQDYRVYRDGALRATVTGTAWADTGLGDSEAHGYHVRARDTSGNESAASSTVNATTFCGAAITTRSWNTRRSELTLRATCTLQPSAAVSAYADGALLGAMTWRASRGAYELVRRLPARPACASVLTNCGGEASSCF
ncbi:MAG: MBL fold metallo-hydrolase [Deltaproteobacteria bacterium]|nr:MBL fold metallo-hydrolase [Deltaproteobacteria bacterium]